MRAAGQTLGTQFGQTLYSPAPLMATGEIPEADLAAGTTGATSGPNAGTVMMGIGSAASAAGQTVCAIANYVSQNKILDIQQSMAEARFTHEDKMAQINKDMQTANLQGQEQKLYIQRDGQKELNAATLERKKAEDQLIIAKAKGKEMKLTDKAGKLNDKALNSLFSQYGYGNPIHA